MINNYLGGNGLDEINKDKWEYLGLEAAEELCQVGVCPRQSQNPLLCQSAVDIIVL